MNRTPEELSAALVRLEDERAIERIIYSYGHVLDFEAPQAYAALFTEDAVVEIRSALVHVLGLDVPFSEAGAQLLLGQGALRTPEGFSFTGHEALRRFVTRERKARSLHVCSQALVDLQGRDEASAVSYLRIYRHVPGAPVELTNFGRYLDRFKRTPAGWRISHRICEL